MDTLTRELKEYLLAQGADMAAFADLRSVDGAALPFGVSIAAAIDPQIVSDIPDGPTAAYFETYHSLNRKLNGIASAGAEFLKARGFRAFAQTTEVVREDGDRRTPLPHKTVAVQSGLGWIGKSNLLVTEAFGSAIRLTSLLTDAALTCGTPFLVPKCGGCEECVRACPGQALTGTHWQEDTDRDALVNIRACTETQQRLTREKTGITTDYLCGKCFVICPYTRRYLKNPLRSR